MIGNWYALERIWAGTENERVFEVSFTHRFRLVGQLLGSQAVAENWLSILSEKQTERRKQSKSFGLTAFLSNYLRSFLLTSRGSQASCMDLYSILTCHFTLFFCVRHGFVMFPSYSCNSVFQLWLRWGQSSTWEINHLIWGIKGLIWRCILFFFI